MWLDWTRFFSLIGTISIFVVLILMGLLSKRLGTVTRTRPYYFGFFVAALLMGINILIRVIGNPVESGAETSLQQNEFNIIFYGIFPALSLTLGVIIAWRYWSWLFAERN